MEPVVKEMKYGGTERVVYALAEALAQMGHEVTLYSSEGSHVPGIARHIEIGPILRKEAADPDEMKRRHAILLSDALTRIESEQDNYDILHSHLEEVTYGFGKKLSIPVLTTCHGPFDREYKQEGLKKHPETLLAPISDAQKTVLDEYFKEQFDGKTQPNWTPTVPHGLPLGEYFSAQNL